MKSVIILRRRKKINKFTQPYKVFYFTVFVQSEAFFNEQTDQQKASGAFVYDDVCK